MIHIWKYIFFLVLIFKPCVYTSNFIHHIVNGSLSDLWNINVTLFANDFKGMVLYCVDSDQNKLSIKVYKDFNFKKHIRLSYNNAFTRSFTSQSCGCDSCNERLLNFYVIMDKGKIFMKCNQYGEDSLKVSKIKDNIPQIIFEKVKDQNSVFLALGNVDGSEDLIGCLKSFYFNNTRIKFNKTGKEFLSNCQLKCNPKMCNKGKCGEKYPFGPICDCSSTALNGRHCNRPLKEYKMGNKTSFQKKWTSKQVQFKLSFQQKTAETYCFLDLIYKSGNFTLTINGDYLLKDSEVITPISPGEMNFINVNITETRMIIKNSEKTFVLELPLWEKLKINIGFSEKKTNCKTFDGFYDFYFNTSQLEKFVPSASEHSKKSYIWIIINVVFVLVLISLILGIIYIIRLRKKLEVTYQQELISTGLEESTELQSIDKINK